MVIRPLPWLAALVLGVALASTSCKVLVEDNCANQSVPGNEFCRELYGNAAPYCSPCRRELNGCVQNPPYSCQGYYDEVSDEDDGLPMDESSSDEGEAPTGDDSSGEQDVGSTGDGDESSSSGTGSTTTSG